MNHEVVCSDCGINVPWELQYGILTKEREYKIVCEECAKKYGFNTGENESEHN